MATAARTPGTIVSTHRAPETTLSARVIADVADTIYLYQPSSNPFTAITGHLRKRRKATQYKYDWIEKDEYPRTATVVSDGATTITFGTNEGKRFPVGAVLLNTRTREQVLVTTAADTSPTITRAIGTTQQTMAAGDICVLTRVVAEDGATIGTLKSIKEVDVYNYTEIQRWAFGWTGRQANTDMYGGSDVALERKVQGIEHAKNLEQMFLFGARHTMTGTHVRSMSGGLEYFIKSNFWNLAGKAPTERAFIEFLEEAMRWGKGGHQNGSSTKWLFHSARWGTEIEFWARDRLQTKTLEKVAGLKIKKFVTTHGTIMLVHAPALDYNHPDLAFLVDMNHVRYVYHQGRDTKLLKGRQGNSADTREEEYFSDVGVQVELEASHAVLKGIPV
jgi:hypothetical protein